ncbi:MAG TPA: 3-oxoacyl-[acyl-carrier-protein] reductase [Firmicutes bacterium]|nr:3-oxoacyl-[acyl-carrier-protein] reductase [Candidatus Fermentithermobacillaceae bacterium]
MSVCLVTGASRGIGRACSVELARAGWDVAVNYSRDEEGAIETARLVQSLGRRASLFRGDVSSHEESRVLIENVERELGPLDVVVLNAGITKDGLLMRMSEEDWDRVLDVNLKGVYNVAKWAARAMMRRRSGRIIAISSVVALTGNIGQANYCASKAGIIGFVRALARELSRYGITANVVAPGYIQTDMTEHLPNEVKENLTRSIPLGRLGTPEDVASAVSFLAGKGSAYITGQVLPVDGGMSMGALT